MRLTTKGFGFAEHGSPLKLALVVVVVVLVVVVVVLVVVVVELVRTLIVVLLEELLEVLLEVLLEGMGVVDVLVVVDERAASARIQCAPSMALWLAGPGTQVAVPPVNENRQILPLERSCPYRYPSEVA